MLNESNDRQSPQNENHHIRLGFGAIRYYEVNYWYL